MKSEFSLFQNLSGTFNGFSAILVSCVFNALSHEKRQTSKNAKPSVLANFTWRLPLNLQNFFVERQKTLNLADFILILADLISLAYFMQHHQKRQIRSKWKQNFPCFKISLSLLMLFPSCCLAFLMPCRMKNARLVKMPDNLCWHISRGACQ